jgi:hypothetical protein
MVGDFLPELKTLVLKVPHSFGTERDEVERHVLGKFSIGNKQSR